jgi:methyl-accepting chemotaxis protein
MSQITATVRSSVQAAQLASQLATEADGVTQDGSRAVSQLSQTMQVISEASRRIQDIIGVIEGIAFQTNLLALNAAVEAARAGEQGRGFAVVAAEVRQLAQRTGDAAKEVRDLLADSASKVELGATQTGDALRTMDKVLGTVRRVTQAVGEIGVASNEQLQGISQINDAVSQLDAITQQNAALVEQTAAAADALRMQADGVAATVRLFHLDGRTAPCSQGRARARHRHRLIRFRARDPARPGTAARDYAWRP